MTIIGTKWVFRNKLDENGIVSRNKARLQEGIDYDETYAPFARLESIRILLAYAYALDFKLFQMDVKSVFRNDFINEEVYVAQPPGFIAEDSRDDPYQTNPPSSDEIILYVQNDQEGQSPELLNDSYVLYDRVMNPLIAQQERKTRKDCGTRRGRHSTSSSSAFDQPSSSHFNDDDVDENDEGTSPVSTPSPTRLVNSLTNKVPRFFQNPPNDPEMKPFYTRQIKIINRQVQLRDEHRGGLRSIRKGLRNLVEKHEE
ncbi:copia protein, partial [Tanacetum coccineum]